MKRRDLFRNSAAAAISTALVHPIGNIAPIAQPVKTEPVKNIIFMVSDGMSTGTLNMADIYLYRKYWRYSNWLNLYRTGKANRAFMDTASASSLVTDSSAASSAWGNTLVWAGA